MLHAASKQRDVIKKRHQIKRENSNTSFSILNVRKTMFLNASTDILTEEMKNVDIVKRLGVAHFNTYPTYALYIKSAKCALTVL